MLIRAEQRYLRMSPTKLRLVASALRGINEPQKAIDYLTFIKKRAALPLSKVVKQAIANAKNNKGVSDSGLKIHEIQIMEGPRLKRWRPASRGMARPILKRTSHIRVILESGTQENEKIKDQKAK